MATLIKLFYAAALTTVIILLVSFGVQTFYDGPEEPTFPGQFGRPPTQEEQTRFEEERQAYESERADYHRNVFIAAGVLGLACVVAGVVISSRLDAIRLGFVAGGVGLIIYGIIQGAEDFGEIGAAPIFVVAVIGMAILLAAGYRWLNDQVDEDKRKAENADRA
jgi:hypothetical protein